MAAPDEPHVLIIGAGLTGLLIAHGLKKSNLRFSIFESEEYGTFRPKEWTMGVHWGMPIMERLLPEDIAARLIDEASVDNTLDFVTPPTNGSRIYDGVTGELLKDLAVEGKLVRLSRRKLRKLISEGIDVKFGHTLDTVTYSEGGTVTAHFGNGTSAAGTTLVGADGPKSAVRNHLFSTGKADIQPLSNVVNMTATFPYKSATKAEFIRYNSHPVFSMSISPEIFCYLCIQDARSDPADWQFFMALSWSGERGSMTCKEATQLAKEKARTIQEPFRSAILDVPEDVTLDYVDIGYWVAELWESNNGRVTLAGDAAHPMPPFRGQGLNHAIQDAWNFVKAMKKVAAGTGEKERIIQDYSDEVAQRGKEETELTIKNAYMMLAYEDFKQSPYMKHGLSKR